MTDEELERMRTYAGAAREHPTWSVAYAQDVPKLLAELERTRGQISQITHRWQALTEPSVHHRLRWLEMICDQENLHTDINGEKVPWRQAARLSEALDGEPVTDAEPLEFYRGAAASALMELEQLKGLLADVAASSVGDDARLAYVTVTIERDTWDQVREQWKVAPMPDPGVKSGD